MLVLHRQADLGDLGPPGQRRLAIAYRVCCRARLCLEAKVSMRAVRVDANAAAQSTSCRL